MNDDFGQRYLEKARSLGINIDNPNDLFYLTRAIKYCEALLEVKYPQAQLIAERTGFTEEEVKYIRTRNPFVGVAAQIVFTIWVERLRQKGIEPVIMEVFNDAPEWYRNMSRIAKGDRHPETGRQVLDRDAIAAFSALTATRLHQVFMESILAPDSLGAPQLSYLEELAQDDPDIVPLDGSSSEYQERGKLLLSPSESGGETSSQSDSMTDPG